MKPSASLAQSVLPDAWRRLWRPIVPTLVLAGVVAAAAVAIFSTTGLAMASQQRTFDLLNSPEGRLITIVDARGAAGIDSRSIEMIQSLTGVEWVIGAGPAKTVHSSSLPGGPTVTARAVYGDLSQVALGLDERILLPGQAVAGPDVTEGLGLVDDIGHVTGSIDADIVGSVHVADPLGPWNDEVLVAADDGQVLTIYVSVADLHQLAPVQAALRGTLIAELPTEASIETNESLAALSTDVIDELTASSRQTVAALLTVVVLLVGAVQFGRVSATARDIGRRRALGASRSLIVASVLVSAALAAAIGAVVGTAVGVGVTLALTESVPRWSFTASIPLLLLIASLIGGALPAVRASRLDPVAFLRVP